MPLGRVSVLSRAGLSSIVCAHIAVACASEAPIGDDSNTSGTRERTGQDTSAPDAGPKEPACEVPNYPDDSDPVPFERLEARVVDTDGAPVANIPAQACGFNLCLFGDTDADGRVVHDGQHDLQRAAFKYGDGVRYAQLALLLGEGPDYALGDQITLALPPIANAKPFHSGSTLRSGGVELTIAPDADVEFDVLAVAEDERVFLASEFPPDRFPETAQAEGFAALFALGPVKTKLCPPAQLRLPNSNGIAAGTKVELFAHGTDVRGEFAPYGQWARVSGATVSDDGEFIETNADEGLPFVAVIGVR